MLNELLVLVCLAGVDIQSQHLDVTIAPATHEATIESAISVNGAGPLRFDLTRNARISRLLLDGQVVPYDRSPAGAGSIDRIDLDIPIGAGVLRVEYTAVFEQDAGAGERPGEIHNFSVDAHIGADGVFLSDGSAWHPRPIGEDGREQLHRLSVAISPIDGWVMVGSGDPVGRGAVDQPRWRWKTPRPVEGIALAGNTHVVHGVTHDTPHGRVEIVMHVPPAHAELAPLFVEAAREYLDLYTPLLGRFPYRRFTIVENFFSSGFAFPGFTLLGPQVVGMAPRSLAPGYLDHELIHNWWGNGVYVDRADGNWCEALTSFCANYYRRIADDGEDAGRAYRRGILMKLSTDPEGFDDGPLGQFGSADPASPGPGRFVGYDKGAFVFAMLDDVLSGRLGSSDHSALWAGLRRFAADNMGRRAGWSEIQAALETARPEQASGWLDGFFRFWVREHHRVKTAAADAGASSDVWSAFQMQIPPNTNQRPEAVFGPGERWCEIDPDFRVFRVLPPGQIVPTIAGTFGKGGFTVRAEESRPEVPPYLGRLEPAADGESMLLIGAAAAAAEDGLLARIADPIVIDGASFEVGGVRYDDPGHAVLHTMPHPDRPGRFITVFHANGDAGWSRLRLIGFYTRDTTIVWKDGQVVERRVFEPDRRIHADRE